MKDFFKNKIWQEQFDKNGFVVVPFVSQEQLNGLEEIFFKNYMQKANSDTVFFYSLLANSAEGSMRLKTAIGNVLEQSYEKTFQHYSAFSESFLAKPNTVEPMELHQDWNYTDETIHPSATVWCPLATITKQNGALFALKGSHLFFKNFRSGNLPSARIAISKELDKHLTYLEIKAGDAVIFHPALFHGSCPNQTNRLRVIAASVILPENTAISYFHRKSNTEICHYTMEQYDFMDCIPELTTGAIPQRSKLLNTIEYQHQIPTEMDLIQKLTSAGLSTLK